MRILIILLFCSSFIIGQGTLPTSIQPSTVKNDVLQARLGANGKWFYQHTRLDSIMRPDSLYRKPFSDSIKLRDGKGGVVDNYVKFSDFGTGQSWAFPNGKTVSFNAFVTGTAYLTTSNGNDYELVFNIADQSPTNEIGTYNFYRSNDTIFSNYKPCPTCTATNYFAKLPAQNRDSTTVSNTATINMTETANVISASVNDGSITPAKLDRGYLTGLGVATRVAFWSAANELSSSANLFWDATNNELEIKSIPLGSNATGQFYVGVEAARGASNASYSNFFGFYSGYSAASASYSNFFGAVSGTGATDASNSNFFGAYSGTGATNASYSNFFGGNAGNGAINASYSNFFGYDTGSAGLKPNNIIIGTSISMIDDTENSMNIGGVLFGKGFNSGSKTNNSVGGKIGINTTPANIARTLHVTGEVRITDLTTDTPTRIVGADADGDLGEISIGNGLTNTSGTLTANISGTTNYVSKFTPNGTTLGNSLLFDNGTNVGINNSSPSYNLDINGTLRVATRTGTAATGAGFTADGQLISYSLDTAASATNTYVTSGTNISVTGDGTMGSPYTVNNTAPENTKVKDGSIIDFTALANDTITATIFPSSIGATELSSTGVTAASYTFSSITVDQDGRITSAGNGSETDPTVGTHIKAITTGDISNWNNDIYYITKLGVNSNKIYAYENGFISGNGVEIINGAGLSRSQSASTDGGSITLSIGTGAITDAMLNSTFLKSFTEVDGNISNEGALTVKAGASNTSLISSNTSGSTDITITAGTGLGISESGNVITLTNSSPNVVQTISTSGAAGNITLSNSGGTLNLNVNDADADPNNELQTIAKSGSTVTLSNGGGSFSDDTGITSLNGLSGLTQTFAYGQSGAYPTWNSSGTVHTFRMPAGLNGEVLKHDGTGWTYGTDLQGVTSIAIANGGGLTVSGSPITTSGTITLTATDPSLSNEGALTVGAGAANTSIINSNTSGSTGVTITAGTGLSISESGNVITLNNTGLLAEFQSLSFGSKSSGEIPLNITGTSGVIFKEGTNITLDRTAANLITINASGGGGGTVTSVTASSPLASSGGTTPNITIQNASTSQTGALTSTDWNTFNGKVGGAGTTNYLPKWTSSTALNNSQLFDNGANVGINTNTPLSRLHITNGNIGAYKTGGGQIYLGSADFENSSYFDSAPGIGASGSSPTSDLSFYTYSGNINSRAERMKIFSGGVVNMSNLAGTGTRMVTASSTGDLSTAAIPVNTDSQEPTISGNTLGLTGTGTSITVPNLTTVNQTIANSTIRRVTFGTGLASLVIQNADLTSENTFTNSLTRFINNNGGNTAALWISGGQALLRNVVNASGVTNSFEARSTELKITVNNNTGSAGQVLKSNGTNLTYQVPNEGLAMLGDDNFGSVANNTAITIFENNSGTAFGGGGSSNPNITQFTKGVGTGVYEIDLIIECGNPITLSLYRPSTATTIQTFEQSSSSDTHQLYKFYTDATAGNLEIRNTTGATNSIKVKRFVMKRLY